MHSRVWLVLILLVAPLATAAVDPAGRAACAAGGVPCGRIYPTILLQLPEGSPQLHAMSQGAPLELELTLSYRFDALNDGYTITPPNDPVLVTFEFPRKPQWVDMKVEPETFEIPVNDITKITPPADPNAPTAFYEFNAPITVRATLTGQAVLRDGYDFAKLLVFAKSSESGLYQAGYGIKELRVQPEGAVHEADVAGQRDVFEASPLPALNLAPLRVTFGGTTVEATPPESPAFWSPGTWSVEVSPAPGGRAMLALHDEAGDLVASRGPLDFASGAATMNATLAKPGLHTLTVTLLPPAGTTTPPITHALSFEAGDAAAEGYQYPKAYVLLDRDAVPLPIGSAADPTMQWERDYPFFAFDLAQSVSALVTLVTESPLPIDAGRSLANIQFSLLDPDGNLLSTSSVDPTNPQRPMRVGSLPSEGWYTLRLRGVGAPLVALYDVRLEVAYNAEPSARNRFDGAPDITPPLLARAGRNLTLPTESLGVWSAADFTPRLDGADAWRYSTTVFASDGALAYASGVRSGSSSFTPPWPGTFRAFVFAEPAPGVPFSPLVRAFTFSVGEGSETIATTFPLVDEPAAPPSATETLLALYAVPVPQPGAKATADSDEARLELVDAQGNVVDAPDAEGTYYLRVLAANAGPEKTTPFAYDVQLAAPQTFVGPSGGGVDASPQGFGVPGVAIAGVLLLAGAVAVGFALVRRR